MGRKPRVVFNGAIYHTIQRGNNRTYIFENALDKDMFFEILSKALEKYDFKLLYFVLMDNHYHLLLETAEATVSQIMKYINGCYAKYYNKKYHRTGTIYEGRYSATLVLETAYYIQLIKYIAYNPVRAGIVKTPDQYRYCAHFEMINKSHRWISPKRMLALFELDPEKAYKTYMQLIDENLPILGIEIINLERVKTQRLETLDTLLRQIAQDEETYQLIKLKDRSKSIQLLKINFVKQGISSGFFIRETAEILNLSPNSIRNLIKK